MTDTIVHADEAREAAAGKRPVISIVIPVFNEERNILPAYEAVLSVFKSLPRYELEFVFTDNHSLDGTFGKLTELARKNLQVKIIRFNRNYGFQRSLLTAYRYASGAAAIQIDCDLQDPPALIPEFLALWEQGHDVVVGVRRNRVEPRVLTLARRAFYAFLNVISDQEVTANAGDFRLIDRTILDQLRSIYDVNPYMRGLTSSLAVNEGKIPYDRRPRQYEQSKFPARRLFRFAIDGIVGHSIVPLRFASYIGVVVSLLALALSAFYILAALLFGGGWPSGFATTTVLLLFNVSLNAIFMGILGEYVSRIYQQVQQHPLVVIEKAVNVVPEAEP
jgi:glycosyltransferase involved in cell wall biosynthesis